MTAAIPNVRDYEAAAVPVEEDRDLAEHSWVPIDLIGLDLEPPEPPRIGGLVYPGRRHVFSGEPESLKSWAALALAAGEIKSGENIVYIDLEMGRRDTLSRLRDLSLDDHQLARFSYIEPSEPIAEVVADVKAHVANQNPSLVVIDAMTGALVLHGFDPNSARDIETFYRQVVAPLEASGAATVILDHLPKDREGRGKFAIGSERKIGAVDVHLGFQVMKPFGRGKTGRAKIIVHKDRPGYLARPKAGELELISDGSSGRITWQLELTAPGDNRTFRPTSYMEKVSRVLEEQAAPQSRNAIERAVKGKAIYVRGAVAALVDDGFAVEETGARGARLIRLERPYRESSEASANLRTAA